MEFLLVCTQNELHFKSKNYQFCFLLLDYDWGLTENSTVVDVGGGYGEVLLQILKRFKNKGIIYDLPKVMENTRKVLYIYNKFFDSFL
jgi:hypothetical protein